MSRGIPPAYDGGGFYTFLPYPSKLPDGSNAINWDGDDAETDPTFKWERARCEVLNAIHDMVDDARHECLQFAEQPAQTIDEFHAKVCDALGLDAGRIYQLDLRFKPGRIECTARSHVNFSDLDSWIVSLPRRLRRYTLEPRS